MRRRHVARTGVRVVVMLCVFRAVWLLGDAISSNGFTFGLGFLGAAVDRAMETGLAIGLWLFIAFALMILEQRLVRWLVPMPTPDHVCHQCGYSLKNLKSPVCPECGVDLSPRGRIPPLGR